MAGGDGSLAIVASVASRHDLPFVVVPAGTRNHFALDLGIDRADVPGALDAFDDGVDTRVDLAEINGRVFVNNASMGVYAKVVQSADYRDAKVRTAAGLLPDMLGPAPSPSTCTTACRPGRRRCRASSCWCRTTATTWRTCAVEGRVSASTPECSGWSSLRVSSAAEAEQVDALEMSGQIQRFAGWNEWTGAQSSRWSRAGPVEVGVDGEALTLDPPLRFVVRPGAVTIRLPRAALRRSRDNHPTRITARSTLAALWQTATGHRTEDG